VRPYCRRLVLFIAVGSTHPEKRSQKGLINLTLTIEVSYLSIILKETPYSVKGGGDLILIVLGQLLVKLNQLGKFESLFG